jgi:hypothetical protein
MILVRDVFQAKYGQAGEFVALLKEGRQRFPNIYADRVLTDASGQFYTVVAETEVASLADWEKRIADIYASAEFGQWFARMVPLVESGRREFYNIET